MKILIIEDNESNMKFVLNLLEMSGYETLQAYDAESGIDIALEELPDLIIMDIHLPGIDGLTATMLLKGEDRTKDIPVIATTSLATKEDEEKMKRSDFDVYITKPFNYKEFLETVRSVLATSDN